MQGWCFIWKLFEYCLSFLVKDFYNWTLEYASIKFIKLVLIMIFMSLWVWYEWNIYWFWMIKDLIKMSEDNVWTNHSLDR